MDILLKKALEQVLKKVLNKVRSLKKVLKEVNLLQKGFKKVILLKKVNSMNKGFFFLSNTFQGGGR